MVTLKHILTVAAALGLAMAAATPRFDSCVKDCTVTDENGKAYPFEIVNDGRGFGATSNELHIWECGQCIPTTLTLEDASTKAKFTTEFTGCNGRKQKIEFSRALPFTATRYWENPTATETYQFKPADKKHCGGESRTVYVPVKA